MRNAVDDTPKWRNMPSRLFLLRPLDRILQGAGSMKSRRLTVSSSHPESRAVRARELPSPMPFLRLRGRWLDQAGFAIGANVRVEVSAGRLVLEVESKQA
jgi:hypothetical protein